MQNAPSPAEKGAPRVTVGMPVFNGAKLLRDTLENLERQSFGDFQVFICDNGSTDATPEICQDFARRDSRFHHVRSDVNIGALPNFFKARDQGTTPLFMWRAFDDVADDNYIEELVKVHDGDPGTLLATCDVYRDGSPGTPQRFYPYTVPTDGARLVRLYRQMLRNSASWYYGLWRHDSLIEITDAVLKGYQDEWAFDQLVLFGVALKDGVRGTRTTTFHQRKIIETRDYIPRPKPSYAVMSGRVSRFAATGQALLAASDLTASQKAVMRLIIPYYARRRCHNMSRLFKARIKAMVSPA